MLRNYLQLIRRIFARHENKLRLLTSNFCLGVSISLFFSLFIKNNPVFYVDTWCGKLVPLDYSLDDNIELRAVMAAVLFVVSIITRKDDKE